MLILLRTFLLLGLSVPCYGEGFASGIVTTDVNQDDVIRAGLFMSDGKIVTVGRTFDGTFNETILARYTAGGLLDTSFGSDGFVMHSGPFPVAFGWAHGVAIGPNNRLITVGRFYDQQSYNFFVSRYLSDGTLDTSFSSDGHLSVDFSGGPDFGRSVAVQADNKPVIGGYSRVGNSYAVAFSRLTDSGVLDTSFSSDGRVTVPVGTDDRLSRLVLSSDEKIVGAGYASGTSFDLLLTRLLTSGAMDTTFGSDGVVTVDINGRSDMLHAITIDGNNLIVVAGTTHNGNNFDFLVARFLTTGVLDTAFSSDGMVTMSMGTHNDVARGVSIDAQDRILSAGYSHNGNNYDFAVARMTTDGLLDTTFNTGGVTTAVGTGSERSFDVLLSNSFLIAAGRSHNGTDFDFAMVRYNADASLAKSGDLDFFYDSDGISIQNFSGGNDEAFDVVVQADDKIVLFGRDGNNHVIVRYSLSGDFDTTFSSDGVISMTVVGGANGSNAGTIDTSGRIVAVGEGGKDFGLIRSLADGVLDTAFLSDRSGTVSIGQGNRVDVAFDVMEDSQGRLVVVGDADGDNWGVVRLLAGGTLDTAFSNDGTLETDLGSTAEIAYGVAIQTNGRIVAVGNDNGNFGVARYLDNGTLDSSFSNDGLLSIDIGAGTTDEAKAVVLDDSGNLVVVGSSNNDVAVVKLLSSGAQDTTFDVDGKQIVDVGTSTVDSGEDIKIDGTNRLIVAGTSANDFLVLRLLEDGTLDTSFSSDGIVTQDISASSTDSGQGVDIDGRGMYVVGGTGGSVDLCAIRLLP